MASADDFQQGLSLLQSLWSGSDEDEEELQQQHHQEEVQPEKGGCRHHSSSTSSRGALPRSPGLSVDPAAATATKPGSLPKILGKSGSLSARTPASAAARSSSGARSRSAGSAAAARETAAALPGGGLRVADYTTATADALQAQVQLVQNAVGVCKQAFGRARDDVTKCMARIQEQQQHLESLEAEEAELLRKVPLPVSRLARVRQWHAERCVQLQAEQATLEGKQMALLKAESQLRARETEGDLLAEAACSLSSAGSQAMAAALKHAAAVRANEVAAAERQLKRMQAAEQQVLQEEQRQQAEEQQRAGAAQAAKAAAKRRLAASQAAIKQHAAVLEAAAAAEEARRLAALLSLKEKIDEVRSGVAHKAERFRQLQKQKREMEQREFEALQEAGVNPYEVYKTRELEAAAARAAAELAAGQAERRGRIAQALADEDKEHRRRLAKNELDRQVEEDYQRQMGIAAQQQRTEAYMLTHTIGRQALLDPTSRLQPHPSQAVLAQLLQFGLSNAAGDGRMQCEASRADTAHAEAAAAAGSAAELEGGTAAAIGKDEAADGFSAFASEEEEEGFKDLDDEQGVAGMQGGAASRDAVAGRAKGDERAALVAPKLSKFERDRLREAQERHKQQVAQPKTMFGRTFGGNAFIAEPPQGLVFEDFVPGQTYKATLQLINRGFAKNCVRLLEVPAEVMHIVELDMPPSGWLAPGAAATLRAVFTPKADEDLCASIPLLAETGPLSVPLRCLARRALPSVDPCPTVDLNGRTGGVMLAASSSRSVVISNAGALDVVFDIQVTGPLAGLTDYEEPEPPLPPIDATPADLAALAAKADAATRLAVAGFTVTGIRGRVAGHSSCSLSVRFTARVVGDVEVPLLVRFTAPDSKGLAVAPVALTLKATGRQLPVSTLTPVVDFKCVMFGQTYVAPLLLANAGTAAIKALVGARPELEPWIKFSPEFAFVQAGDTLTVSISLKPTPDMLARLATHLQPDQQDVLEVPLQVAVPGQTLPVHFKLRVQPTTADLHLRPGLLDFGHVPLTEAAGQLLVLHNPSLLPQAFSFGAKLPPGVAVSPSAYGQLLPGETRSLVVRFRPLITGPQFFALVCRTTAGRQFKVEGKCEGLQPDITLSHNVIKFPATVVGDTNSASLTLANRSSSTAMVFELGVPQGSCLQVTPRVGCIQPGRSLRLQLDFAPPASLMAEPAQQHQQQQQQMQGTSAATTGAAAAAPAVPAAGAAVDQAGAAASSSGAEGSSSSTTTTTYGGGWRWCREWLLPCYARPALASELADMQPISSSSSSSSSRQTLSQTGLMSISGSTQGNSSGPSSMQLLHLAVSTCAVGPELQLAPPGLPRPLGKNYCVLDFGALPVGERSSRQLLLTNSGPDVAPLSAAPLDPCGVFQVVTALRPVEPSGSARLLLAFNPQACCECYEMLTIKSAKSRLRIALKGLGIAPSLAVTPASVATSGGGLSFGDVLISEPACRELKFGLTNTSPFSVTFTTRCIGPPPAASQATSAAAAGAPAAAAATAIAVPTARQPAVAGAAAAVAQQQGPKQTGPTPAKAPTAAAGSAPAAAAAAPATADEPTPPGTGCFFCAPAGGTLAAGQTMELTVTFAPAGVTGQGLGPVCGPCVTDRLQICVPYQQQDLVVPLQGNAWTDGVFVSGLSYRSSSCWLGCSQACAAAAAADGGGASSSSSGMGGIVDDPFAIAAAAAAATAAAAAAGAALPAGGRSGKQSAAGTAQQQQQQTAGAPPGPTGSLQAAMAAAGYADMTQGFCSLGSVVPGQTVSATLEFGAIKSSGPKGLAGELLFDELPAAVKEAGWLVDPVKVSVPAGERRPLVLRFTAPPLAKLRGTPAGALLDLGLPLQQLAKLHCTLKGGCQPVGGAAAAGAAAAAGDGSRRLTIVCSCVVVGPGPSSAAAVGSEAAAVPAGAKPGGAAAAAAVVGAVGSRPIAAG